MSDYKGAALMLSAMPKAKQLLADKGYDADWFRAALAKRRITPCIPSKANRKTAIPHDAVLYKQRHKIENMFGRLKDWRRIHTRYDRCAHTYFSPIAGRAKRRADVDALLRLERASPGEERERFLSERR